jgi:polyphosphate kinase
LLQISHFFNALTGYSRKNEPAELLAAPVNLRQRLEKLILRDIAHQERGEPGHLMFKMNALEDPEMIRLLYRASQAGVKVDLLVRGLCCLRPSVGGVSDNIRVTSIVDRFLEHSRIYYFRKGGREEIYLGSADLMRRNLSHRVEIIFPVKDPKVMNRLKGILELEFADQRGAHHLHTDGHYARSSKRTEKDAVDSQTQLLTREAPTVKAGRGLAALSRKRRSADRRAYSRTKNC